MKTVVVLDGERHEVEVDLVHQKLRVGVHEWPIRVEASTGSSVTFELMGERIDVRGDSPEAGKPEASVTINGELHTLVVESTAGSALRPLPRGTVAASPVAGEVPSAGLASSGPGQAIVPPMPGKVLEVRVRNGERVRAGQVLLVLEAMKMRNEVTSPVAGEVSELRVSAGSNVGAHDALLRIVPS